MGETWLLGHLTSAVAAMGVVYKCNSCFSIGWECLSKRSKLFKKISSDYFKSVHDDHPVFLQSSQNVLMFLVCVFGVLSLCLLLFSLLLFFFSGSLKSHSVFSAQDLSQKSEESHQERWSEDHFVSP